MSDYASRLNSFNQSVQLANKHVANVASVIQDPKATIGAKVENVVGDIGNSSAQIMGNIIGYKHFKSFMNLGQNLGNKLTGLAQAGGEAVAEGEQNMGNVLSNAASQPGVNVATNAEPAGAIAGSGSIQSSSAPSLGQSIAPHGGVAPEEDDDGFPEEMMNIFGGGGQDRDALGQATDDLVNAAGLGEDGSIMPGEFDESGATQALGDITNLISGGQVPNPEGGGGGITGALGQAGQAGEDAVNASKAADNIASGASDAANAVSKSMGTIDTIADIGEGVAASSEMGGIAAPAIAVTGGLISLGAEIAKAFTPQTKAPSPTPPAVQSAPPPSMQVGVNLSQNQGDSGVSHGIF